MSHQHTLTAPITLEGIGLHSGAHVTMTITPAPPHHGIVFMRSDIDAEKSRIRAHHERVTDTRLGTTLTNEYGVSLSTVEHLMAALWGAGLDNALITLDAPEVPIMDGSSAVFIEAINQTGLATQEAPRRYLRVLKPIIVRDGESSASVEPLENVQGRCQLDITIDFDHPAIRRHRAQYDFSLTTFEDSLSRARTFGFAHEVKQLQSMGLARGGSLDNAIVVGEEGVINEEGLRYPDEFIRHKALDCLGDLFLAGYRMEGRFTFIRPGHTINNALLRKLFEDITAYEMA